MIRLCTESLRRLTMRIAMACGVLVLCIGVLCLSWHESLASKTDLVTVAADQQQRDPTLVLTQGMADIVEISGAVSDVMVADPSIVDVMALQANRLYMVGTNVGTTNVIAIDAEGNVIKRLNVIVKIDDTTVLHMLHDLFPDEKVNVTTLGEQVVLTGHVSTPAVANRMANVAARYVNEVRGGGGAASVENSIVNMLTVAGEQQVMLRVKIIEASRDVLRELGVTTSLAAGPAGTDLTGSIAGAVGAGLSADPLGIANVIYNDTGSSFGPLQVMIRALEQEGLLNTLAEPNLTAVSGEEAGFLAGGEFPIPAGRDQDGNIVIEYRPFGVALNFRPVVLSEDRISLQLQTEVSAVSNQNTLDVGGLTIPGFSVRRAQTTVEMASGGSLMIAGLLQSEATRTMTDLPGIKNIPILGDLMSSDSFNRNESELVVIVTSYMVSPYADENQAEESVSTERNPLAHAFESNIRRTYNRRPLAESLFTQDKKFGYLID